MKGIPECYGKLLPDLSKLQTNRLMVGKALSAFTKSMGMNIQGRAVTVTVDDEQWRKCVACESYSHCYDLSVAKLLLHHAI